MKSIAWQQCAFRVSRSLPGLLLRVAVAAALAMALASLARAMDLADLPQQAGRGNALNVAVPGLSAAGGPISAYATQCPGGSCPAPRYYFRTPQPPAGPAVDPSLSDAQLAALMKLPASMHDAVVRVWRGNSGGSGTLVIAEDGAGVILTAAHVLEDGGSVSIVTRDGRKFPGGQVLMDQDGLDLAAIVIDQVPDGMTPVEIGELPQPGQLVLACGYGGGGYAAQPNRVLGYARSVYADDTLEMEGRFRSGDSGGGIFDGHARLVAIVNGSEAPGQVNVENVGICCRPIKSFLARIRQRLAQLLGRRQAAPSPGRIAQGVPLPQVEVPSPNTQLGQPAVAAAPPANPSSGAGAPNADQRSATSDLADRLDKIVTAISALKNDPATGSKLNDLAGSLGSIQGQLNKVSGTINDIAPAIPRIQAAIEAAKPLATAAAPAVALIPGVGPQLSAILLAIASTGGTWGLLNLLQRRGTGGQPPAGSAANIPSANAPATAATGSPTSAPAAAATGASAAAAPGTTVVLDTAPPPQVVERRQTFVPYEAPSSRLQAFEMAMEELVRKYPSLATTVDTLNRFADQFESGLKKTS